MTDQQRRAIAARGVSVALSAGAGCGKTFVLTERFLAELDPDGPNQQPSTRLSELVAITFTERAAREMRDRIRTACRRRAQTAPAPRADYWLHLLRELDSARISTIHSFCGGLLRAHAVEARLDPQFRVLEPSQADTLLYELIDDELRSRLAARDEAMIELVVEFGLERLREMLAVLLDRRQDVDWPRWQSATPQDLTARWESFNRDAALPSVLRAILRSWPAQAVLDIVRDHWPDHPTMQERFDELRRRLPGLVDSVDPAGDLDSINASARVQGGGPKKAWPDEALYDWFRAAAEGLRKLVKAARVEVVFEAAAALPAAEAGLRLLAVARSVDEAYDERKRLAAALDFNDLLIRARQLLTAPEHEGLRREIAGQIRLLLVDEFQDTDPLQVELIEALSGDVLADGKLFFVGDYKQSIYRFRGADPDVFRRLRNATPERGRLPLARNFRSQPAVVDFANALFCEDLGPEYEPLVADRPQVGPEPAVELLWAPDPSPDDRSSQSRRLRRREADWIARRLRTMIDGGQAVVAHGEGPENGKPAPRAVRPGDVAVLFRALSDVQYYEEALQRYDIDYYLVGGHAFYAQQEIYDLLSLLRSLAGRCDEVSLAGALRSSMFGLDDETLYWLAQHPEGLSGGLFSDAPPEELADAQKRRVAFAKATLTELRAVKDRMPIAELIERALSRTGYDAVLLAEFLGERKLANLRKLIDQARSFDRAGVFSLADFITQLSQFVARQPHEPLAATQPESTDVVRLMTIHQSKGLEFPVVVVPDVDRPIRSSTATVAFTPQMGPMVKTTGPGGFQLYAAVEKDRELAELIRLFYVASTRAADYLILSGGVIRLDAPRGPWTQLIHRRFDPLTGKLRVTLPVGYREPRVKVTTTEPPLAGKPSKKTARPNLGKLAEEVTRLAERDGGRAAVHLAPVPVDRQARRQYSFSRLSGTLHERFETTASGAPDETDDFCDASGRLDPLGLGTLVHEVLAEVDFGRPQDVAPAVARMAPRHLPEEQDNLHEPTDMIHRFLDSPRAAAMAAASEVHRELEFTLAWPPGTEQAQPRYLQGYIDCLYRDAAGRWVVLDYKTNRVTPSTIEAAASEYEMQMLLYALAVERILGSGPSDLVLYFLRPAREHHFRWDAAARRRVEKLVNQALDAFVNP
jgi:ATP-dependent helicase/nuclease subunit A